VVGILLLVIIIYHAKAQALKFLFKSELEMVMSSSIGSASVLFTVQPVIAVEVIELKSILLCLLAWCAV
jgi:hypothetical protein